MVPPLEVGWQALAAQIVPGGQEIPTQSGSSHSSSGQTSGGGQVWFAQFVG
jgi:hypothetical protein